MKSKKNGIRVPSLLKLKKDNKKIKKHHIERILMLLSLISLIIALARPQNLSQFSDIAKDYFETFDYNFESKVLKRLLKYLHEYIESMRN